MQVYPKTETPDDEVALHNYRTSMLESFKIYGRFWEVDASGEPSSSAETGILEWNPAGESQLVLPDVQVTAEQKEFWVNGDGHPVCLQGDALYDIDGRYVGKTRLSLDAFGGVSAMSSSFATGQCHWQKRYKINSIWEGNQHLNLRDARFSQVVFSFQDLELWIGHHPTLKVQDRHIRMCEWDILRDFDVSDFGRVRLLCGHDVPFTATSQTAETAHVWQVDFSEPVGYTQCREAVSAVRSFLNIATGASMLVETMVLVSTEPHEDSEDRIYKVYDSAFQTGKAKALSVSETARNGRFCASFSDATESIMSQWIATYRTQPAKDLISLVTLRHRADGQTEQYSVLSSVLVLEKILKESKLFKPNPDGRPAEKLSEVISDLIPEVFPQQLSDPCLDGMNLAEWAIKNRNKRIAHLDYSDPISSWNQPAAIYADRLLHLLAVTLLVLEFDILSKSEAQKIFWQNHRTQQYLNWLPEKMIPATIFSKAT